LLPDSAMDFVLGKVPGDVGLADDADQFVPIDDREATYAMFLHGPQRFLPPSRLHRW
jgi:hypothetical protein